MIKDLFKLANRLDKLGLRKEADVLDSAIRKLSQTTGNVGSAYNEGKEIAGTPGTTVKFYASTPKSITDFNKFLAGLIRDVIQDPYQSIFSAPVKSNIASLESQTSWSAVTNAAFADYARAVGRSEAGKDWQAFAKANNYAPSLAGVFAFWQDTIGGVINRFNTDEKKEGDIPSYDTPAVATPPVAPESPATAGARMAPFKATPDDPLNWDMFHLWLNGTFEDKEHNQLWNISEFDKSKMKDFFVKDTAVQDRITPLMGKITKDNGERNAQFKTIIKEWYRKTLKEKGVKGWYKPDTEEQGEIVPDSGIPSPAKTRVTASSYNSMIKGIISR